MTGWFRRSRLFGVALALSLSTGCSPAAWQGLAAGLASAQPTAPVGGRLLVFGGAGHDTFLGCLSCNKYQTDSLFNTYGQYGGKYSGSSISNPYSAFGSKYSTYSACNPYATDPPIVVTEDGQAIGRLTINRYNVNRIKDRAALQWLAAVCAD